MKAIVRNRVLTGLAAAGLVLGGIAEASPAFATTDSCTAHYATPSAPSGYNSSINYSGTATCTVSMSRTLQVQLWHYYDFFPSVEVTHVNQVHTGTSYSAGASVCDNGPATTTYYTDVYINEGSIEKSYTSSPTVVLDSHC